MSVLGRMTLAGVCCLLIGAAGVVIWWPGRRQGPADASRALSRDEISKGEAAGRRADAPSAATADLGPACRRSRTQ